MELSSRTTNFEAHGQLAIIADNTRNDEDDDKEESIDEASVIVA